MENTNQFLGTERVGKLMRRYAVPCIISLLVGALYNIVDQIFIANASYLASPTSPLPSEMLTNAQQPSPIITAMASATTVSGKTTVLAALP